MALAVKGVVRHLPEPLNGWEGHHSRSPLVPIEWVEAWHSVWLHLGRVRARDDRLAAPRECHLLPRRWPGGRIGASSLILGLLGV